MKDQVQVTPTSGPVSVAAAVQELLSIVARLRSAYPHKRFTLDGRLVGDIGEVLVSEAYDVRLLKGMPKHHDGKTSDGRLVQVKATMQRALTFPADHVPDFYLGIIIYEDGQFSEVFNGPGVIVARAIQHRKTPKTNLHSVGVPSLLKLNRSSSIPEGSRVAPRPHATVLPIPLRKNLLQHRGGEPS